MALGDAAESLGVSRERVRQLVSGGSLPGIKFGNAWAIPRSAVLSRGMQRGERGRPLGPRQAWEQILAGSVDLGNVTRYSNRGSLHRFEMSQADAEYLSLQPGVLIGGIEGAITNGQPLVDDPQRAWIYVPAELFADLDSRVAAVPDPLGGIVLRVVPPEISPMLSASANGSPAPAPPAAVALDLMESADPRHWLAAEQLIGS